MAESGARGDAGSGTIGSWSTRHHRQAREAAGLLVPRSAGDWLRRVVGLWCLAAAAVALATHLPGAVNALDGQVSSFGYIASPSDRLLTSGDALGIPRQLQAAALADVPPSARYAVLLPTTPQLAGAAGISSLAYETVGAWLRYLLLPAVPVTTPAVGQYVVCWGCDMRLWDTRTRWLWQSPGQAVGLVVGT